MPKFSISLSADLAAYAQAAGDHHPRGVSGVVAEALTSRQALEGSGITPTPHGAADIGLMAVARHAIEDGAKRELRNEIRIAELADILAAIMGQTAADNAFPARSSRERLQ